MSQPIEVISVCGCRAEALQVEFFLTKTRQRFRMPVGLSDHKPVEDAYDALCSALSAHAEVTLLEALEGSQVPDAPPQVMRPCRICDRPTDTVIDGKPYCPDHVPSSPS